MGEQRGAAPFGGAESHERSSWSPPSGRAGGLRPVRATFAGWRGEDGRRWDGREGLREGQGGGGRTAAGRPPGGRASGLILRAVQVTKCNNYAGLDFTGGFGGAVEKGKYGRNG